jgi:hypothetical protein
LLQRLIGDIVWMAGGAEMSGEDNLIDVDDPWTGTHLVTPVYGLGLFRMKDRVLEYLSLRGSGDKTYFLLGV